MQPSLFESEAAVEAPPKPKPKPKPGIVRKPPRPLPEPLDESATHRPRLPHPLRDVTAGEIERELALWADGKTTADELMRFTRGATYPLENAELVRVLEFMVTLLRGTP